MPENATFKKLVRARMERTGESYMQARDAFLREESRRGVPEWSTVVAPCAVTVDRGRLQSRVALEVVPRGLRVVFDGEELGLVATTVRHGKAVVADGEYDLANGWAARFETESEEPLTDLAIEGGSQSGGSFALLAPGLGGGGRRPAEVSVYFNADGGVVGSGGSIVAPTATIEELFDNSPPAFRPAIVALSGYIARYAGAATGLNELRRAGRGGADSERIKRREAELAHWRARIVSVLVRRFADVADWAIRYIDRSLGLLVEGDALEVVIQRAPTDDGFVWTVVNRDEYRARCALLNLAPTGRFTISHDNWSDLGPEAAEAAVVGAFTHGHPTLVARITNAPYPVTLAGRAAIATQDDGRFVAVHFGPSGVVPRSAREAVAGEAEARFRAKAAWTGGVPEGLHLLLERVIPS